MPSKLSSSRDSNPFDPFDYEPPILPDFPEPIETPPGRSYRVIWLAVLFVTVAAVYIVWQVIKVRQAPASPPSTWPPDGDGLTWPTAVALVEPSVVHITSYGNSGFGTIIPQEQGSGVIYSKEGEVLTNAHVVLYGAQARIEVTRSDGSALEAELVGVDPCADLAVLRLPTSHYPYPVPAKALDQLPGKGDEVAALGYGRSDIVGGADPSVTRGSISRLHVHLPPYSDLIQHDAAINPGNSGGPLIDRYGRLVGINTLRIIEDSSQGLFFAIPISQADAVWQRLRQQRPPQVDSSLRPLHVGDFLTATIRGQLDRQCWSLSLEEGHRVAVRVRATDPVNPFDPELWIYGPMNLLVDYNDDSRPGNTLEARVAFIPSATGIYTAVVVPEPRTIVQAKGGPYELRVERP